MDSLNDLLSPKGGRNVLKPGEKENDVQGLFYDLLACLAGGDHPSLPQGFKPKPMTGFSAILEAFNDNNKIREAGSGVIKEVGSKDFDSSSLDELSPSLSSQNADSSVANSAQCLAPPTLRTQSQIPERPEPCKFTLGDPSQHQWSSESQDFVTSDKASDSDVLPKSTSSSREATPPDKFSNLGLGKSLSQQMVFQNLVANEAQMRPHTSACHFSPYQAPIYNQAVAEVDEITERLNEDPSMPISDKLLDRDENGNWNYPNNMTTTNESATWVALAPEVDITESTSITEVGPPLSISHSSVNNNAFPRDRNEIERELSKYSDQIRELKKVLKENLSPSPYQSSTTSSNDALPPTTHFAGGEFTMESNPQRLIGEGGMVKRLMDGMMTPSSVLDKMYDVDSIGSKSPHLPASAYLSTYQSCTSLASSQNTGLINPGDSVRKTNSLYMDCQNEEMDSDASHILAKEMSSLNVSHSCTDSETIMKAFLMDAGIVDRKETKHSVTIVDYRESSDGNDEGGYYSVSEDEKSEEDEFEDCNEVVCNAIRNSFKKRKKKRNQRKHRSPSSSECLWTSASASEAEISKQKVRFYDTEQLSQ